MKPFGKADNKRRQLEGHPGQTPHEESKAVIFGSVTPGFRAK